MRWLWRMQPRHLVPCFLIAAVMTVGLAGCGEPVVQSNYDDLDDATRVRVGPVGEETLGLSLEASFSCEGDNLCRPDSVHFVLTSFTPGGKFCPKGARKLRDSGYFDCQTTEAKLILGTEKEGAVQVPAIDYLGKRQDEEDIPIVLETIMFELPYENVRRVAEPEVVMFQMGGTKARVPGGYYLSSLVSMVEDEADPDAEPWDAFVTADYDEEADSTSLRARLPQSDSASRGFGVWSVKGQCPGRGWCRPDVLTVDFIIADSSLFLLNLADVRFVLDDSLVLKPRFVEVSKQGPRGFVDTDLSSEGLKRMVEASEVTYMLDTASMELVPRQASVLRRFLKRIQDAE